jgi:hypothetical protein
VIVNLTLVTEEAGTHAVVGVQVVLQLTVGDANVDGTSDDTTKVEAGVVDAPFGQ